ncbi:hypothetical protein [Halocatena pleomorpha]|uniref:Uncharacterized protein n=1 Tax=Halocatena pleomorpha TaxID=1785090 RepID=A0A3P3R905_9EURY|nr:hypothetical protein [Halocatena pleomorpha]RRJ29952.1 hypothetical protein EIK79_11410 [Halocatena pleomorpha]
MISDIVVESHESLFAGQLEPGDEPLAAAIRSASVRTEGDPYDRRVGAYEDVLACLTEAERDERLAGAHEP